MQRLMSSPTAIMKTICFIFCISSNPVSKVVAVPSTVTLSSRFFMYLTMLLSDSASLSIITTDMFCGIFLFFFSFCYFCLSNLSNSPIRHLYYRDADSLLTTFVSSYVFIHGLQSFWLEKCLATLLADLCLNILKEIIFIAPLMDMAYLLNFNITLAKRTGLH